jgi:hypothetical protein
MKTVHQLLIENNFIAKNEINSNKETILKCNSKGVLLLDFLNDCGFSVEDYSNFSENTSYSYYPYSNNREYSGIIYIVITKLSKIDLDFEFRN